MNKEGKREDTGQEIQGEESERKKREDGELQTWVEMLLIDDVTRALRY